MERASRFPGSRTPAVRPEGSDEPEPKGREGVAVVEAYNQYQPPAGFRRGVETLLAGVPERCLAGLGQVILRDAEGLLRRERRSKTRSRGRKVPLSACRGLYHASRSGRSAHVELFVDNIVDSWPSGLLRIPFLRDIAISETLFHELGRHMHATVAPEFREREDVADAWRKRLRRHYFRRRYWYLLPLLWPLSLLARVFRARRRRRRPPWASPQY